MLVVISLAGCSKSEPDKEQTIQESVDIEADLRDIFALETINGNAYRSTGGLEHPRIEFQPQLSMVMGNAGCNEFRGSMSASEDGKIKLENVTSHMSTCPQIEIEKEFLQALKDVNRFERKGLKLNLYRGESLLLSFRKVD
jgi:heat shock protein HslJ